MSSHIVDIFVACYQAIRQGVLIKRESIMDKEFHFQDWFRTRLESLQLNFDAPGRNKYPDSPWYIRRKVLRLKA